MANRRYTSQFSYSFEKQPVVLMGSYQQTDLGAFASLVNNGITWTAVSYGTSGNSITIAIVGGGTAGAEVVTVNGNAIQVQIESGVSTRTQVETAVNASAAAIALVSISVASGGTAASLLAATALSGGDATDFTEVGGSSLSLTQIGTGLYQIDIADSYAALLASSIMIQKASAADLAPQIQSVDVSSSKQIVFRLVAGATPTNLANNDILYIQLTLRNA